MNTTNEIIAAASRLPVEEQAVIAHALFANTMEKDCGPEDSPTEVKAAWSGEIQRRLDDVDQGRVKLVDAKDAERMIRNGERPEI